MTYGPDGYLYGATFGLANENGAIFRLNPDDPDDFAYIHAFDGAPAGKPTNRLILVPTSCCDNDLFPPELACPGLIELIDLEGDGVEAIAGLSALGFSAADDCTEATMSISPEVFPQGSTEATVTAVDEAGNAAACIVTVIVTGPCPDPEQKLLSSDGESNENFGYSVAISGTRTIAGAYRDNDNGSNSGSAYIYHWDGFDWEEEHKITPGDGNSDDYFGQSVAISGDWAIVGAPRDDDNESSSGSAYLFRWDGAAWVQHQKLTASDGATGDLFGFSVSIGGDKAIVGAYQDDDNGSNSGSAYLFHRDGANWVQQQKLTAADGAAGDLFGFSVSIDEDKAIVGAYQDDDNGSNSGSAYLFHWDGANWVQQQKLTAADGTATDFFGFSVSIGGDKAIVGAHQDDGNGSNSGSAYLFHWDGANWVQQQKITASDAAGEDYFGKSVSVSEDAALIGALGEDDGGSSAGAAYLFAWNGLEWAEQEKLAAFDAAGGDRFGYSVALSGNRAAVGAPLEDNENGLNAGAAYPFLIVDTAPDLSVAPAAPVCPGTSVDLSSLAVSDANNTGAVLTYHSGSPATVDNELPSPVVTPASPSSTYYILGTSPAGCTDEVAVTLQAPTAPTIACQDITVELNPLTLQAYVFPDQVASFVPPCSGYALYFQGGNTALPPLPMIFSGCSSAGEYPVTVLLYTGDGSRRRRSCRATITVVAPPPLAFCDNNLSVSLGSDGTVTLNPDDIDEGSYAVCGSISSMTVSPAVLSCADVGTMEVTLTVTTDLGQAASCAAEINVNPWIGELCDGMDNNCNGLIDELPIDQDDDGYTYCFDCDDTDAAVNPGAPETCDGIDNNCNGEVDEGGVLDMLVEEKVIAEDDDMPSIFGSDAFGSSVSISGSWAIVGAAGDNNVNGLGAAYFFQLEGTSWVQKQKVTPSDIHGPIFADGEWFGWSVAIDGEWAIIGAPGLAQSPGNYTDGSAYLFHLEGGVWVENDKITAGDGASASFPNEFGYSVSISGDKAIVGAPKDDLDLDLVFGSQHGSAYIFHRNGTEWAQYGKITADVPAAYEQFGGSVSISGDWAIAGAKGNSDNGNESGAAYLFRWEGTEWMYYSKIFADAPAAGERFGHCVSISAISGNECRAIAGTEEGEAAYLFHWNGSTWVPQLPRLTAADGQNGDKFGYSVSISGDMALVGAPYQTNGGGNFSGAAYPFQWNGNEWQALPRITAGEPDAEPEDYFGWSVHNEGENTIIGAVGDSNENGTFAGAAYISATVPCGAMRPGQHPTLLPVSDVADAKASFTLFPNPALDEVSLQFDAPLTGHGEVWVYGLAGRLVLKQAFEAGTSRLSLPIRGLPSGLYLVEVKTGDRVFPIRRFVKGGE